MFNLPCFMNVQLKNKMCILKMTKRIRSILKVNRNTDEEPNKSKPKSQESLLNAGDRLEEDGNVWISGDDPHGHSTADQDHGAGTHRVNLDWQFDLNVEIIVFLLSYNFQKHTCLTLFAK
jgi:hypothetical protein